MHYTTILLNIFGLLATTRTIAETLDVVKDNNNVVDDHDDVHNTLHLLVYETDDRLAHENSLMRLQEQHQHHNIPGLKMQVVGTGQKFAGFGSKYPAVLPVLAQLHPSAITVISDGRDVLLNHRGRSTNDDGSSIQSFLATFRTMVGGGGTDSDRPNNAIVVSAEAQCCVSALTYAAPGDYFSAVDMSRTQRACFSGHDDCLWNGDDKAAPWEQFMQQLARDSGSPNQQDIYLNAGLMVGRAADLIRVLTAADIGDLEDDQAVLTDYLFRHPTDIVLDYNQALFGNNRADNTCMFEPKQGHQQLVHKQTGTAPLFIHTPGAGKATCHESLLAELGQSIIMSKTVRRRLSQWTTSAHNYKPAAGSTTTTACPSGFKRVSGYCVRSFCFDDFTCPPYSARKVGRECYNDVDDCQCQTGYKMSANGYCVKIVTRVK